MKEVHVVTVFLQHNDTILIVKRSAAVGSFQGRWSAISGYVEPQTTPLHQAYAEVREETTLTTGGLRLLKEGKAVAVQDGEHGVCWVVHPFLFDISDPGKVSLDWENVEKRWIKPHELDQYETVPALAEVYRTLTG